MGLETLAIVGLGLSLGGTVTQAVGGIQAAGAAKGAQAIQSRLEAIRTQRERINQVRQARIARAEIESKAAATGTSESSGAIGGAGAITSQQGSNIGFINVQESMGRSISNAQQRVIDNKGISAIGAGISDIGASVFNNQAELTDIFGG